MNIIRKGIEPIFTTVSFNSMEEIAEVKDHELSAL